MDRSDGSLTGRGVRLTAGNSTEAETWIRRHADVAGPIGVHHERPWATVLRVPVCGGVVWFKACAPVQAFEPRLTVELSKRWPDLVADVLAFDAERGWLLLRDAGAKVGLARNPPEPWLTVLPLYAELQRGEAKHSTDHLSHDVPDMRIPTLAPKYEELVRRPLPIEPAEVQALAAFSDRFAELCAELEAHGVGASVQHDDLHAENLFESRGTLRILDWGDSSISNPFLSLVVPFRFLEEVNGLPPTDPWFTRFRDAYLEAWGPGMIETFDLAVRIGAFAHAIAWLRQRDALPAEFRPGFDTGFAIVLRRAIARIAG